ncbi:hypothetical protein DC20_20400 [Rufibacter tibetensis]|uniref:Uncharacterized protein n=1 Tax=Rufibacter tibetensis TaxID=512763 RepID=A0A0P0CG60_9BACT|nr:hypothetical protein DC20_20400 [Rufibacter tibetensis]
MLPIDYVGFLRTFHGFKGLIGNEHVVLWCFGELESLNMGCALQEKHPTPLKVALTGRGSRSHWCG